MQPDALRLPRRARAVRALLTVGPASIVAGIFDGTVSGGSRTGLLAIALTRRSCDGRSREWVEMPDPSHAVHLVTGTYAALFIVAALSKADDWNSWVSTAASISGRPGLDWMLRWTVPVTEMSCAATLLWLPRIGLAAATALAFMPARIGYGLALRNLILACLAATAFALVPLDAGAFVLPEVLMLAVAVAVMLPAADFVRFRRLLRSARDG